MKLDYETCKKLKEAGFPQDRLMGEDYLCKNPRHFAENCKECVKTPSLSELIDACGEEFDSLNHMKHHDKADHTYGWGTNLYTTLGGVSVYDTPEQAVANLYLKLNESH